MEFQTLEEQLQILEEHGIELQEGVTIDDLLFSHPEDEYMNEALTLLLIRMGGEVEREPYRRISKNALYLDTECVVSSGDYVWVYSQLGELTGVPVDLEKSSDQFTENGHFINFEIVLPNHTISSSAEVQDDWLDTLTLMETADAFEHSGKRIAYIWMGQCLFFIFCNQDVKDSLSKLTGWDFDWFSI